MKWITHQTAAVAAAYALHMPPLAIGAACCGAVLPDMIERSIARLCWNSDKVFFAIHRGVTHWLGWWLALVLIFPLWGKTGILPDAALRSLQEYLPLLSFTGSISGTVLAGLGFGGLMHVLLDMCTTSGVPLLPLSKKKMLSLRLCSTGSVREFLFLLTVIIVFSVCFQEDLRSLGSLSGWERLGREIKDVIRQIVSI